MLVSRAQFEQVVESLTVPGFRGLDTETTSLDAHGSAYLLAQGFEKGRLFSLIIAPTQDQKDTLYFNFQRYPGLDSEFVLPRSWLKELQAAFEVEANKWAIHNAKYDQAILENDGLTIKGFVQCTLAIGRVENNMHMVYDLDTLASKCLKQRKDDTVEKYIKEHKLYTRLEIPGRKDPLDLWHMEKVPLEVVQPYAELDARLTLGLAKFQQQSIAKQDSALPKEVTRKLMDVARNEMHVTQTFYQMERQGARVNLTYAKECYEHEVKNYTRSAEKFTKISGIPFQDGRKVLTQAFTKAGEKFPLTEKGNPSFRSEVLEDFNTPLAKAVLEYREGYKLAHTYYGNFMRFADARGFIHANVRQGGTIHGRVSYSDPNLQNLPSAEDVDLTQPYLVRRCFEPDSAEVFLVSKDFKAMEFRLMLDYAKEMSVIERILGGMDPHEATRQAMGLTQANGRSIAKRINFGLLYGMGPGKLAVSLGVSVKEATELRDLYFAKLQNVESFMRQVTEVARRRGYLINVMGRRVGVPKGYAYKGINYLISGSCADLMKKAMVEIHTYLKAERARTRITVQIHDELLFNWHKKELHLEPQVTRILENVYEHKALPLTTSTAHSFKSWADLEDGMPKEVA